MVFAVAQGLEETKSAYAKLKALLPRFGRDPGALSVLPGIMPILGGTQAEAKRKLDTLQGFVTPTSAIKMLSTRLGQDMSRFPLDAPVPDLPLPDTSHGFARTMLAKARRENMTLRDLYDLTAAARGHWVLRGTPETVADTLEQWFIERAADGFNILPAYFPDAFTDFVEQVVPILQARGLFRRNYGGTTPARAPRAGPAWMDPAQPWVSVAQRMF